MLILSRRRITVLAVALALTGAPAARSQGAKSDSAVLREQLHSKVFEFLMAWRYVWWEDQRDVSLTKELWRVLDSSKNPWPPAADGAGARGTLSSAMFSGCRGYTGALLPSDPLLKSAKALRARSVAQSLEHERFGYDGCSVRWRPPIEGEPPDPRGGADLQLTDGGRAEVAALRKPLLKALDEAAQRIPGDAWVAGQRVRMHVDHGDATGALVATRQCKAARWWCLGLRGYVWYAMGETSRATAVFDSVLRVAPDSVVCEWTDVSPLLTGAPAQDFKQLPCIDLEREQLVERLWWLSDPLYLEPGNERKVEHFGRRMLLDLHTAVDSVDGIFDYRDRSHLTGRYEGFTVNWIPIQRYIIRYGFPLTNRGCDTTVCLPPLGSGEYIGPVLVGQPPEDKAPVQKWRRLDTKELYLGNYAEWFWAGPQYHVVPTWAAVVDPFHAVDDDWNLGPPLYSRNDASQSWGPPEFITLPRGPIFQLESQVAFLRRWRTALLTANAQWDTVATFRPAPRSATFGVALGTGPRDTMRIIVQRNVDGRALKPILTSVASVPQVMGIEMIPTAASRDGGASRTRFGIVPPQPLTALIDGGVALSDLILTRHEAGQNPPSTLAETLERMLPTTRLRDPRRIAIVWEAYGILPGDTVDVALRIARADTAGSVRQFLTILGLAPTLSDSVVQTWTEPRRSDAPFAIDGGVTYALHSVGLDISALTAGRYSLAVSMTKRLSGASATATRTFIIQR